MSQPKIEATSNFLNRPLRSEAEARAARIAKSVELLIAEGARPDVAERLAEEAERDMESAIRQGRMFQAVLDMILTGAKCS
jgi:hypothetical protein